jgi:hypothetical protein
MSSEEKTFVEALAGFQYALSKLYHSDNALVKIALEPDVFDRVMYDLHETQEGKYSFSIRSIGEVFVRGVQLLPRKKESF